MKFAVIHCCSPRASLLLPSLIPQASSSSPHPSPAPLLLAALRPLAMDGEGG